MIHLTGAVSSAATANRQLRRLQGYSPAMLVEESRLLLQLHQSELEQGQLLANVVVIADEVDLQLMQAVRCWEMPAA